jgi:hypothetical protein
MNFSLKGNNSPKLKIIIWLIIGAAILIITNLILQFIWQDNVSKTELKKEIDKAGIEKLFNESLSDLGFEKTWINRINKGNKLKHVEGKDLLSYIVSVPADLPITVVLNEIFISFKNYQVKLESKEQKINGRTLLNIFKEKELKLTAEFHYDKTISRNAGHIGIFVSGISNLSGSDLQTFLSIPETFELLLVPSKKSSGILQSLNVSKRKYAILLNDDITDIEYKLSNNYSNARLKSSIRNILGKFYQASVFIIDNKSSLFSSIVYPLITEEFKKRKLNLVLEDSLSNLVDDNSSNALKDFRIKIEKIKRGEEAEFVITASEFQLLQPEIIKYRKIGYKFILPSELLSSP